jgi:predicted branched-subunit amino acid permease
LPLSARVTWRSFQAGAWRMVLPGLASLPFGIGFGVAAAQKGLSAFETTLMSFTVFAGTSQMVALAASVFVANLRYFVMGAALQPYLPHLPWYVQPPVWHVTVDQNWAVNIAEYRRGHGDLGKFFGGGFVMACIWSGSTLPAISPWADCSPIPPRRAGWDWTSWASRCSSSWPRSCFAASATSRLGWWLSPPPLPRSG